ncbi:hypothetical protein, unlikely [Trypanosoma brucei brucei TREU927]|uniref:Uncharacterized protein n=1 Tax=Trypanosoma brucei brucei (strain 927/4 GUTat10.1) TaxID=185431 RepID=Q38FT3_TRYB2|nr:hypothetical protein, unlikely [Trypanosoma brucei brucei TREU927]EAN76337.1 hypothetical protein, unlikely [Trypanosoma brucei brucei TREU927]
MPLNNVQVEFCSHNSTRTFATQYFDVKLDWIPTGVLRRVARRLYPSFWAAAASIRSYSERIVRRFSSDEACYPETLEKKRRMGKRGSRGEYDGDVEEIELSEYMEEDDSETDAGALSGMKFISCKPFPLDDLPLHTVE